MKGNINLGQAGFEPGSEGHCSRLFKGVVGFRDTNRDTSSQDFSRRPESDYANTAPGDPHHSRLSPLMRRPGKLQFFGL